MILINLLPHREAKRQARKRAFFAGLGLAALVGVALVLGWFTVVEGLIRVQSDRNAFLAAETKRLDAQIKDIATLKSEIDALKARQKAVEDLQADRNMPVYLLNELVKQTPEGVYLTSVRQQGQEVVISGLAQTNERISELLRNTAYNSPWFEKPDLGPIKSTAPTSKDQRRLSEFSVKVLLKRPAVPGAASAPAGVPVPQAASGAARPASSGIPAGATVTLPAAKPAASAQPVKS